MRLIKNWLTVFSSEKQTDSFKIFMKIENNPKNNESNVKRQIRFFESSQLFGDNNEIMIRHDGSVYRLRITRNGKLIMNK